MRRGVANCGSTIGLYLEGAWHPGERGGLRHIELVERLAVKGLRRRRDAVGALAEEHDIQIQPEDLLLGELMLHAVGDEGFRSLRRAVLSSVRNSCRAACMVMVLAPWV